MREIRLLPEILPGCLVILFAGMLRSRFACSEQVAQVSSLRVNLMDKLEAYPTNKWGYARTVRREAPLPAALGVGRQKFNGVRSGVAVYQILPADLRSVGRWICCPPLVATDAKQSRTREAT